MSQIPANVFWQSRDDVDVVSQSSQAVPITITVSIPDPGALTVNESICVGVFAVVKPKMLPEPAAAIKLIRLVA